VNPHAKYRNGIKKFCLYWEFFGVGVKTAFRELILSKINILAILRIIDK